MDKKYLIIGGVALAAVGAWYFMRPAEAEELSDDDGLTDDDVDSTAEESSSDVEESDSGADSTSAGRRLHDLKHKKKQKHKKHNEKPRSLRPMVHSDVGIPPVTLPFSGGPSGLPMPGSRPGGFRASSASVPATHRQEEPKPPSTSPIPPPPSSSMPVTIIPGAGTGTGTPQSSRQAPGRHGQVTAGIGTVEPRLTQRTTAPVQPGKKKKLAGRKTIAPVKAGKAKKTVGKAAKIKVKVSEAA